MADVLGVVASGIAVVGLAAKLAQNCAKIKDFCNQVQDAPDLIAHLLREINILQFVLTDIEEGPDDPRLEIHNARVLEVLKLCEDCVSELEALVNTLAENLDKKGRWKRKTGALKVAVKSEELKRLKHKLEFAISLLSLAEQRRSSMILQVGVKLLVTHTSTQISTVPNDDSEDDFDHTIIKKNSVKSKYNNLKDIVERRSHYEFRTAPWAEFLLGAFEYQYSQGLGPRRKSTANFKIKYSWPSWISRATYLAQGYDYLNTWHVQYQSYRVLPSFSRFFLAIEHGDIPTVQDMLSRKEGFVTDRSAFNDETVLHVALGLVPNVEMIKLLLREGANPAIPTRYGWTPLRSAIASHAVGKVDQSVISAFMETDAFEELEDALPNFRGGQEVFHYLQNQIVPTYYERDLQYRLECATGIDAIGTTESRSRLFEVALCSDGCVTKEMASWSDDDGATAMHAIAERISWEVKAKLQNNIDRKTEEAIVQLCVGEWKVLFQRFQEVGADVSAQDGEGLTPLTRVIAWETVKINNMCLRVWIDCLFTYGVDLAEYGERERQLGTFSRIIREVNTESGEPSIAAISFGSRPQDWKVWPGVRSDIFVVSFWRLVERVLLSIEHEDKYADLAVPGSWIEVENAEEDEYETQWYSDYVKRGRLKDHKWCDMRDEKRNKRASKRARNEEIRKTKTARNAKYQDGKNESIDRL